MAAWLEGNIQGRATGAVTRRPKRKNLRVRLTCSAVIAFTHYLAIADNHGADHGVRARAAARGKPERALHVVRVGHFSRGSPLSISENVCRHIRA